MARQPITWRNIATTVSGSGSDRQAGAVADSMQSSLANFQQLLKDRQQMQRDNWENQRDIKTQDFMGEVSQVRDAEEWDKLRSEGYFQDKIAESGNQIDRGLAYQHLNSYGNSIRARDSSKNAFRDEENERINRDARAEYLQLMRTDPNAAADFLSSYDGEWVDKAALMDSGMKSHLEQQGERRAVKQDSRRAASAARQAQSHEWARENHQNQQALHARNMENIEKQELNNNALTATTADFTNSLRQQDDFRQERADQALDAVGLLDEDGNRVVGDLSLEQRKQVNEAMEAFGVSPETDTATERINQLADNLRQTSEQNNLGWSEQQIRKQARQTVSAYYDKDVMAPQDQQLLAERNASADAHLEGQLNEADKYLEDVLRVNPTVPSDVTGLEKFEDVQDMIYEDPLDPVSWTESNRSKVLESLRDVTHSKVTLSNGEDYQVEPWLVKTFYRQRSKEWFAGNTGEHIKRDIIDYVKKNEDMFIEGMEAKASAQQMRDKAKREHLQNTSANERMLRKDTETAVYGKDNFVANNIRRIKELEEEEKDLTK